MAVVAASMGMGGDHRRVEGGPPFIILIYNEVLRIITFDNIIFFTRIILSLYTWHVHKLHVAHSMLWCCVFVLCETSYVW